MSKKYVIELSDEPKKRNGDVYYPVIGFDNWDIAQITRDRLKEYPVCSSDFHYRRGVKEAWEVAAKIFGDDPQILHLFDGSSYGEIFRSDPFEAIDKVKRYEEESEFCDLEIDEMMKDLKWSLGAKSLRDRINKIYYELHGKGFGEET